MDYCRESSAVFGNRVMQRGKIGVLINLTIQSLFMFISMITSIPIAYYFFGANSAVKYAGLTSIILLVFTLFGFRKEELKLYNSVNGRISGMGIAPLKGRIAN